MSSSGIAFSHEHFSAAYPSGVEHHFWNKARNHIIAAALRKHGCTGTLLEIGCGTGVVVAGLRAMGFDCWGSDLGESHPAQGAEDFLYPGQDCRALARTFRESIHTLLLLDVIEHLEHPVAFLSSVRESFPNARTLLVTAPARSELWSNYDSHYGHFRRYDRLMLAEELKTAGYTPLTIRYFFHTLYPVMRILSGSAKGRETELRAPIGWQRTAHAALAAACVLDARLLPGNLPGTSLLAVANAA